MNEHQLDIDELLRLVRSTKEGLTSEQAKQRISDFGHNTLQTKHKLPIILRFFKQFANFFALLLLFGAGLSFFAEFLAPGQGNLYIGIALAAVVVLNTSFTFLQQYQSERIMEGFQSMMPAVVEVLRDGKRVQIPAADVVIGEIMYLNEGDKISADGRLIEHNAMKVDNSSITGESEPQLRKIECTHHNMLESRNMVFSGTLVQSGNGIAVTYATGMHTQMGKIVTLTKETESVDTPLHKELRRFIHIISLIAIVLGTVFFGISLLLGHPFMGSIIFAIGIIVANVPEGLLPTVTLCLTMASKRMAKKNALIKNLESVETLGSTTVICTDKTGTLTENRMAVNTIFLNNEQRSVDDKGVRELPGFMRLIESMVLCNNAHPDEHGHSFLGDPTETALLSFGGHYEPIQALQKKAPRVHESPFDSKTKRMITTNVLNKKKIAHLKGAPEIVVQLCDKIILNGNQKLLSAADKKDILKNYERMASRGERVLAFAWKATPAEKATEEEFIFLGLVGMLDPPRKEIPSAIAKCQIAGIKVIMITGDYSLTAEAIAKKVGLVNQHGEATIVTGEDLLNMPDESLQSVLSKDKLIFARTTPIDKLRIVKALQDLGEVVTVTGDGVNDAPALKNADMGVAMGKVGTEVAREASDMVLLDDNFATIVSAVEEGRTIFENIKKFIAYILTSNVPEILPFIVFVLLKIPLPLTVVLILAIDLGTDLVPALGLGTEKPESDVMKKPPRKRSERLLTKNLLCISYGIVGMIQAAAGFFSFFVILFRGGWEWGESLSSTDPLYLTAVSGFFASIIICQIADVLICRTRRQSIFKVGVFKNKLVLLGIATELALLAIILYVPYAQPFFGTAPLTPFELSLSVPFALFILCGDEFRKVFVRKGHPFVTKYLMW